MNTLGPRGGKESVTLPDCVTRTVISHASSGSVTRGVGLFLLCPSGDDSVITGTGIALA